MLGKGTASKGRVYAPSVVADLDGDGTPEIVVGGNDGTVAAYDVRGGALQVRPGWPASTCSGGQCPETRGLAAADIDGDGRDEVVATTTNTAETGSQVFVFDGVRRQRARLAEVRRERRDVQRRRQPRLRDVRRERRDRPARRRPAAGDRRHLRQPPRQRVQPRRHLGARVAWYTNPENAHAGARLGWGQFIRWLSPRVEDDHMHLHTGPWPDINRNAWLQWTASPPSIADLDRDGPTRSSACRTSSATSPTRPRRTRSPCWTGAEGRRAVGPPPPRLRAHAADRQAGRARRRPVPAERHPGADDREHPRRPAAGDRRRRARRARVGGRPGRQEAVELRLHPRRAETFASEVVAADLNRDGRPELVFGTYGPSPGAGALVVLSATGRKLREVRLRHQTANGNGVGIAAAPSIADIDGDGRLEIVVTTIDHGIDVYRVPRSDARHLPWPTGRGGGDPDRHAPARLANIAGMSRSDVTSPCSRARPARTRSASR